jgi:hypothetical protein
MHRCSQDVLRRLITALGVSVRHQPSGLALTLGSKRPRAVRSLCNKESRVQLLRSSLPLQVRTARVARPSASFEALPASAVGVANFSPSPFLLRQVHSVFNRFVQVRASLALRLLARGSIGVLPINKAFKTDKAAVSHLLQKAQKLRHGNFAV